MQLNNNDSRPGLRAVLTSLVMLVALTGCQTDFPNPNLPSEEQVLSSREGLIAFSTGTKQVFSTSGLRWLIETPAITTREVAVTTTFLNMVELEAGGTILPNNNSNVDGMWSTMLSLVAACDKLTDGAERVTLAPETRASIQSFSRTIKAMSIGALAQHFERVVVETNTDNTASFVTREEAFAVAIAELEAARDALTDGVPTAEFQTAVLREIDLANTISAMLARFNLYAGNYESAISAARAVDLGVASVFEYDVMNANPIWERVVLNALPNWKPRDNFGLPAAFDVPENDDRRNFYLVANDSLLSLNELPIEDLAGFFTAPTTSIPVYLPDEMRLIIAEAVLRSSGNTSSALGQIDAVRTDTTDVFGVNAGLEEYSGDTSVDALLDEVYLQRRLELFLTGQSLEDSRRFGRPQPSLQSGVLTDERNRNFYPYPERERNSNPNIPDDPAI